MANALLIHAGFAFTDCWKMQRVVLALYSYVAFFAPWRTLCYLLMSSRSPNGAVGSCQKKTTATDYIAGKLSCLVKLDPAIQIETCPGVYAPAEDTYLLLSAVEASKGQRVLEMGCGTGIIALHCARAGCQVMAADISLEAVENARMNAAINGLAMEVIQSDLFQNVEEKFDAIIFNPPYLSAQDSDGLSDDEKRPLVGGEMGHEITARFLDGVAEHLSPGGRIYLLTSSESEAGVLEKARQHFTIRRIAEKRIFFETLAVYEMKLGKP